MKLGAPLLLLLLARPATAELCAARVELEGEAAVVGKVGDALARLGVERGAPAPGCRGIHARVEASDEGIAVAIRDGARRSEGRVVSDPMVAASWIDSWLHDDLDGRAWLLAAPVAVPPTTTAPASVRARAPAAARPGLLERAHLAASWEHAWTDDSASSDGVGLAGCVRVGRLCVGGRGRFVREADRSVDLTAMRRSEASLLATLSLPLTAGRMSIAPELGVGVGRTSTRRIEGCTIAPGAPGDPNSPPNCDPMDPTCVMPPQPCMDTSGKVYVGDNFQTATLSPRLSAGLRLAVPLFDHVWLDGAFSVAVAPMSHGELFANPGTLPDGTAANPFPLPGEATLGMWLGIGLRVGAP